MSSQDLERYRWKNRVLILSDIYTNKKNSKAAYKVLKSESDAIEERDIIVLFLWNQKLHTEKGETLQHKLELPTKFNGYLLIGKDGGVKMKENYPLNLKKVFDRIDSMPMRQAEIKKSNP